MFAAFVSVLAGEIMSVRAHNAVFLEQSGGLVSICTALGAIFLLSRAQEINDSERRLGELRDLVSPDQAHDLVNALRRKDRLDQLTLIVLSAVGSALQAFADAALSVGQAIAGTFAHLGL